MVAHLSTVQSTANAKKISRRLQEIVVLLNVNNRTSGCGYHQHIGSSRSQVVGSKSGCIFMSLTP